MKKLLVIILLSGFCITVQAQTSDEEAVKKVVLSAYVEGIQNRGNVEDIRKGFHPTFAMLRLVENDIKPYPIEDWIAAIEKAKQENKTIPRTESKFISTDITGNAAVVKLDLFREGKRTFTDYLVLYKFAEGWRIVSKTFYRHS